MTEPTRALSRLPLLMLPALLAGGCAPRATAPVAPAPAPVGLPPIPPAHGELAIRVVHPTPGTPLPRTDSAYLYGSVGTGLAELQVNGTPVPVRPNGAFLAFLPLPATGEWRLTARERGREVQASVAYRPPPAPGAGGAPAPVTEPLSPAVWGVVTGGSDTLSTGSDVAIGRSTPGGTYRWFLPRGARLRVTGRRAGQLRFQGGAAEGWIDADAVRLTEPAPDAAPAALGASSVLPAVGWTDLRLAVSGAPFEVRAEGDRVRLTLNGVQPGAALPAARGGIAGLAWDAEGALEIRPVGRVWGYAAWYEGADLVLRLRHPPALDPTDPLRGARILVDPGHPPAGATGPTGLTEAEANLAIGLRLADQLRARGAEVILTRTDNQPVGLGERVELAVRSDAHLLVSVHNNAFGEGVNPFRNNGTSTYYFHPFSADLARALDREIAATTRIPDLGAKVSNLALVRPTWMPSTLTESLYMLIPEQEAALRDPGFLDRLAAAHVRGIEAFLRDVGGSPLPAAGSQGPAAGSR